jgi:hypothetical protein
VLGSATASIDACPALPQQRPANQGLSFRIRRISKRHLREATTVREQHPGSGGAAALGARKRSKVAVLGLPSPQTLQTRRGRRLPSSPSPFRRGRGPAISPSSSSMSQKLVWFLLGNRTEKTETELIGFYFYVNRSVVDSRKTKIFLH